MPVQIKGRNGQLSGESGTNDIVGPMEDEEDGLLGGNDHGAFSQMRLRST